MRSIIPLRSNITRRTHSPRQLCCRSTLFHLKLYTIDFRRKSAPYACRQPACSSFHELLRAVGGAGGRFASAAGALLPQSGARNNSECKFLVETKQQGSAPTTTRIDIGRSSLFSSIAFTASVVDEVYYSCLCLGRLRCRLSRIQTLKKGKFFPINANFNQLIKIYKMVMIQRKN